MGTLLYYCRQTTEACKGIPYPSKSHPYKYGVSGCIYTSGCGVCSSLMVLRNFGVVPATMNTKRWAAECVKMGARAAEGTNMAKIAEHFKKFYGITTKQTKSTETLKKHLRNGGRAIICVTGRGKRLFSNSGHYIYVGGIDKSGNLIILDPYWYDGKFTLTARRKAYTKVKNDREVYVQPSVLAADIGSIWLFTAPKGVKPLCSVNDVNHKKPKPVAPVVSLGQHILTAVRGVYKGCGADAGRKKVSDLSEDGQKHATTAKKSAFAFLKKGTIVSLLEVKKAKSGNLWAKIPSGWICIWEKSDNTSFIK